MGISLYLIFALASTTLLGLIKIFSVIPFNRMAADDFSFAVGFLNNSFFTGQWQWYASLTGRYTSNLLISAFGAFSSPTGKLGLFSVITVVFGFSSLVFFISSLTKLKILNWKNLLLAGILLVTYYVITPSQRDSWYWLNGAATYLWPTLFDIIIISLLIKGVRTWWAYLILFILALLAGGGNELVLVLNFLVSSSAAIFLFVRRTNSSKTILKQTLLVFLATAISLAIVYLSPGNSGRMNSSTSSPMSLLGSILYALRDGPAVVWEIFKNNFLLLVPLFISLAYLFSKLDFVEKNLAKLKSVSLINLILFTFSAPVLLSIPPMIIGYLSLGRILPDRAFETMAFTILLSLTAGAYFMGYLIRIRNEASLKWFEGLVVISSLLIFFSGFRITSPLASDMYIAKNYSQSFDAMYNRLKSFTPAKNQKTFEVKQLPPSGLIRFWQVTGNPEDWENRAVSNLFKINAIIVAK